MWCVQPPSPPPPPPKKKKHALVPKISLAQHKNWKNIQSRNLFINRFTSIALGEITCCKTFDAVRTELPEVRQVTNIRTMCEAFNKTPVTKTLLGEVHKFLRMYLTLPVASATSERTFSTLRRLKNYLRSTMKQDRLNNCLLMHCRKSITDTLDTVKIAKWFACANEQRKGHFGQFE